jgi:hypothetical protein
MSGAGRADRRLHRATTAPGEKKSRKADSAVKGTPRCA